MKKSRFSESQILGILREYQLGISARELARKHGFYYQTLYEWKKRFSGITEVSEIQKIQELKLENEKLKKMYAEVSMRNRALEDVVSKKW